MATTVLVVSDLHLGGPEGFQMCTPAGADRLASFLDWARAEQGAARAVHLVLAGDVVDFLAEPDDETTPRDQWTWSAFAADEALALRKLERILARTPQVWDALAAFVTGGGALTLLLGNHDVELALPQVRRRFLGRVAPAGGRVGFLFDDEAFTLGELVVEHGNRYEGWNLVAHEALRELRARRSRGQGGGAFRPQPGSELVARVMNPIKARYGFVDLLKPETGGVLPILAVLDPGLWRRAGRAIAEGVRAAWRQGHVTPEGPRGGLEAAPVAEAAALPAPWPDEADLALADELAARGSVEGAGEALARDLAVALLVKAFRKRREQDGAGFDVAEEAALYRRPAESLAAAGHRVVVFGHTHHAKRVPLSTPLGPATYLNTGTWADLMRLPEAVYLGTEAEGRAALRPFLDAVRDNDLAGYRRQVPTFARIELDGDLRATAADVLFFDGAGEPSPISTAGVLERLSIGTRRAPALESAVLETASSPTALVIHAPEDEGFVRTRLLPSLAPGGIGRWATLPHELPAPAEAIAAAQAVLAVVSAHAARAPEVRAQAELAAAVSLAVIPVLVDDTAPGAVAAGLAPLPAADFRAARGAAEAGRELADLLPPAAGGPAHAPSPALTARAQDVAWDEGVFSAALDAALRGHDDHRLHQLLAAYEAHARSRPGGDPPAVARRDLASLRRNRSFRAMRRYAEAFLRTGAGDAQVRRQLGQALIELGQLDEAVALLEAIARDPASPSEEIAEARGLLGRAFKQRYVNGPERPGAAAHLLRAIAEYRAVYDPDRREVWQGINAATCLLRASRDGIGGARTEDAEAIARQVLDTLSLEERERQQAGKVLGCFELATRFEALAVLGRPEEARAALDRYLGHPGMSAFEVSSTHRQCREVLQLERVPWGAPLVDRLWRAVEQYRTGGGSALSRARNDPPGAGFAPRAQLGRPLLIRVADRSWAPPALPGLVVTARLGTIVCATGNDTAVRALLQDPEVISVEDSRPGGLPECFASVPFIGADAVHAKLQEQGAAALVAIVDGGIDVLHEAFLDAQGKSRIEEIWDQRDSTGPRPPGFDFGTVHTGEDIARYLAAQEVPGPLGRDPHGHGTHVASVAAGRACGSFAGGVAPEARLLVVISASDQPIGYSASHIAALDYIDRFAGGRPVVVNVSQGMNAGAHDGKSALEVAFDEFTGGGRRAGRVVVKSAGNERDRNGHAVLTLGQGACEALPWTRPPDAIADQERIELWFSSADEFRFRLFDPAGRSTPVVGEATPDLTGALGPDSFHLQYTKRHLDNGDSQLLVLLDAGAGGLQRGAWRLEVESGLVPEGGVIHAWIERGPGAPTSFTRHASEEMTLSIPGTAQSVIAVGAVAVASPVRVGDFSSYGPTRDGRRKPEVAAPGMGVTAADGGTASGTRRETGTSMAAPHVAGAIALLLSRRARSGQPGLTASQITSALRQKTKNYSAHFDRGQGWGVVDVEALLRAF